MKPDRSGKCITTGRTARKSYCYAIFPLQDALRFRAAGAEFMQQLALQRCGAMLAGVHAASTPPPNRIRRQRSTPADAISNQSTRQAEK